MFIGHCRLLASVVHSVWRRRGRRSLLSSTRAPFRSKHDHIAFHIPATPTTSSFVSYAMPPSIHTSGPCSHAISVAHDPMNPLCKWRPETASSGEVCIVLYSGSEQRYSYSRPGEVRKPGHPLFVGVAACAYHPVAGLSALECARESNCSKVQLLTTVPDNITYSTGTHPHLPL